MLELRESTEERGMDMSEVVFPKVIPHAELSSVHREYRSRHGLFVDWFRERHAGPPTQGDRISIRYTADNGSTHPVACYDYNKKGKEWVRDPGFEDVVWDTEALCSRRGDERVG